MALRKAQKVLGKRFQNYLKKERMPHLFYDPQKPLWKVPHFLSFSSETNPDHFQLSLSTKKRHEEHFFELLANSNGDTTHLLLKLAPNSELKYTYLPPKGDLAYMSPEDLMSYSYYVEPLMQLDSNIWHFDVLHDFCGHFPDIIARSNQEIRSYLTIEDAYSFDAFHLHIDLRIYDQNKEEPSGRRIVSEDLMRISEYLATTGRLRSLHLAGCHLYPDSAGDISTRVVQLINNKTR